MLVRPNNEFTSFVNLESEEKFYSKKDKHFCRYDGYVAFRNGELISGNLGKKTLGGDSKTGLFYILIRDYGPQIAIRCMTRLAKLTSRFLMDRGFSIGVDDVTPSKEINTLKTGLLNTGLSDAINAIDQYNNGNIKLKPGCNALQSLESDLNGILSKVREKCGERAVETLHYRNSPLCMATCGSKGSPLNISQMIACLGQQSVGGSRIQNGFIGRTLPHFPVGSLTPQAKGFVSNSFHSGLTATEFFFHTMGGREGLVDTAVKTAETGYMARRLMKALEDLSLQYDRTVRNSETVVIQFSYGDDGLNPQMMERDDRPVEYHRILANVQGANKHLTENPLTGSELLEMVEEELLKSRFQDLLPQALQFIEETRKFFMVKAEEIGLLDSMDAISTATRHASTATIESFKDESMLDLRQRLRGMDTPTRHQWVKESSVIGSSAYHDVHRLIRDNTMRITSSQVLEVLDAALSKYYKAIVEPGEAVGAVGAQSLSEPGTQMTLKTFHFAGVASMNVTLGVPRLKEIINASKVISTPIIEARLLQSDSITTARMIKASMEKTKLGEICHYIREVHTISSSYIEIKLDLVTISNLFLSNVNAYTVRNAIFHNPLSSSSSGGHSSVRPLVLRSLKDNHVVVKGSRYDKIIVYAPDLKDTRATVRNGIPPHRRVLFTLQALKNALPNIIVEGISTVSRAVINEEEKDDKKQYHLLVEGYGLREVMATPGVDAKTTKTNHILETEQVLGIEAARISIASEIKYIMEAYGIAVDRRHLMLLSDVMSFKGEILGITRFGVSKMKESVLMLASFEKTTDHLFDAAVHSREDSITGVSECIIMGVPIPIGTGIFKLLHKSKSSAPIIRRKRLFETLKE